MTIKIKIYERKGRKYDGKNINDIKKDKKCSHNNLAVHLAVVKIYKIFRIFKNHLTSFGDFQISTI